MRELDAIDERAERGSAVESLASLVYDLIVGAMWFFGALFIGVPLLVLAIHFF